MVASKGFEGWGWVMETTTKHFLVGEDSAIITFGHLISGKDRGTVFIENKGLKEQLCRMKFMLEQGVKISFLR